MKTFASPILLLLALAAPAFANVTVSSPWNGETVSTSVKYTASSTTTTCSKGVAAMGVYVDYHLIYTVNGTSLNTTLTLTVGNHNTVVQEWDYCGGSPYSSMNISVGAQSAVYVTSPANNSTVSSTANYVATAISTCSKGVASMGVYVDNQLVKVMQGASLNTQISLNGGSHHTVVQEWDYCGGSTYTPVNVTVPGTVLSNLQATGGWNSWGEFAPTYDICSSNCSGVNWSMWQHQTSPSLTGNASRFNIG